jgi:hypothetical protein
MVSRFVQGLFGGPLGPDLSYFWILYRKLALIAFPEARPGQEPHDPAGAALLQVRCVQGRRSIRCGSERPKSEIPVHMSQ